MHLVFLLATALALVGEVQLQSFSRVKIKDNGFTGLVIAINPGITEDNTLVEAIKESWTNASRDLFIATKRRAYFRDITILLPKTWTGENRADAANETYNQADVVVALPNPSYGDTPYTIQYGGCGALGSYSHFTPDYFTNDSAVYNYGPRGKVIVHEWAHYRWGVFDETSEEFPFYWGEYTDNGPEATRCPLSLFGKVLNVDENAKPCETYTVDPDTDTLYPENCVFFPQEEQPPFPNTSVMSYQYLDQVTTFCHDGEGPNQHNAFAPNEQNRLCNMKSTWTVISESDDFYGNNFPLAGDIDTTPVFSVVRTQLQRYVLVLDTSGSMGSPLNGDTVPKITRMVAAADQMIRQYFPNGSAVGIVDFDSSARTLCPLTVINSKQDREDISSLLPTPSDAGGGTDIGAGIVQGIKELEDFSDTPGGGYLIVLSDGMGSINQNEIQETLDKSIIVDTIYYNTNGSDELSQLSDDSGGDWYYITEAEQLQLAFNKIAAGEDGNTENITFQIQSESFTVAAGDTHASNVYIDSTIGLNTLFSFTWSLYSDAPIIQIISPDKCSYTNDGSFSGATCTGGTFETNDAYMTIKFAIPGIASVGQWIYTVTPANSNTQKISVVVTSMAANVSVEPILVESGMGSTNVADNSPTVVYAKVTQGYNPVLGAYVQATITRPGDGPVILPLYDNGAAADVRRNDGIYSRYFTNYTGPGKYSVEVKVGYLDNVTAVPGDTAFASRANYRPGVIRSDGSVEVNPNGAKSPEASAAATGVQSEDIGEFTRVVSSGGFEYSGPVTNTDNYPPNRVIDLKIQQNDVEDFAKGVVLRFTAPGDNYDSGTATRYEVRYTFDDPTSLVRDFASNKNISEADLLEGSLIPHPAGNLEKIVVNTPELPENKTSVKLGFAVRAYDLTSNVADPSNVAAIRFFIAPLAINTSPAPTTVPVTTMTTKATPVSSAALPTTTTTKPTTTTTTKTTTSKSCDKCEICEPNTDLYMMLMGVFAALTLAFLTSTIIVSVWLSKSRKDLKTKRRGMSMKGVENPYDTNIFSPSQQREQEKVVPVLSKSTVDGKPVIAYVPETEYKPKLPRVKPLNIEY